tara:strand:+ start:832 stop:2439 length:1608 start_codon:yes stop_codon:yes gene_type:complete
MNYDNFVKQCKIFGNNFVIVKSNSDNADYKSMVVEIAGEMDKQGCNYVIRFEDLYQNNYKLEDADKDVVVLLDTTIPHREDEFPKTTLVLGNTNVLPKERWNMSEDVYHYSGEQFVNVGKGLRTMLDLSVEVDRKSSWYTAMKISFTRLFPYAEDRIMLPVFAGPIQEYAIDKLSTTEIVNYIKKKLAEGYSRVIFDDKDEAIFWHRIYKVHSIIKRLQKILPPGSFFFMTSALNAEEIYENWCEKTGEKKLLTMIACARFESVAKEMMLDNGLQYHYDDLNYEISVEPRPKKFLCYNRMPRLHRVKMFTELHKKGCHNQALISFHDEDEALSNGRWTDVKSIPHYDSHWGETFHYFYDNIMPNLDQFKLNKTKDRWNPVDIVEDDFDHFRDTYFSVINETLFYKNTYQYEPLVDISATDSVFLSEKIFKPLACKHPFVVIGVDRTLEHLKKYGYKTFDKWWDESYDYEPNDDKRMEMCVAEIERLTNLDDDEWCRMIEEMIPILQHNFETLAKNKDLIVNNLNLLEIFRSDRPY